MMACTNVCIKREGSSIGKRSVFLVPSLRRRLVLHTSGLSMLLVDPPFLSVNGSAAPMRIFSSTHKTGTCFLVPVF